jgi:NAD(P)-dependent dehydrogenase (short-subunit alcohol dehydrogenase family)
MSMPGNRTAYGGRALAGRVALITGASGGIGQAIGRRLASEGARLALAYGANGAPAKDLAVEIIATGGQAVPVQADLGSAEAPAALIEATEDKLGPVDVLVSNAGLGRRQSFEEIACRDFDEMIAVNLRARIPAGRLGRPEEVADLAVAVLGNAYLTNQVIGLDGGMYPR